MVVLLSTQGNSGTDCDELIIGEDILGFLANNKLATLLLPDGIVSISQHGEIAMGRIEYFI